MENIEQRLLRGGFEGMFANVEHRIRSAQESGEVSGSVDSSDAATMVYATSSGKRI